MRRNVNPLLRQPGYLFATGTDNALMQRLSRHFSNAYRRFAATWNGTLPDPYLRDGGTYRKRRYSVFHWQRNALHVLPHEPHYQSNYHNQVHGGFNRHFRDWLPTTVNNPVVTEIVRWCVQQFDHHPSQVWRIQAHQFRIESTALEAGKPTPEGVHKDGADYILIMLIDRDNVQGGISDMYDNDRQPLEQHTLQNSGDLLLINDEKVYHGVTEIIPQDKNTVALRDVLVLTFHRQ